MTMKLYGSLTSPYVRRIRFLALELEIPHTLVDTMTQAGQAELRSKNPIWKVPYAEFGQTKIWDSHAIMDYIFETFGSGVVGFRNKESKVHESNLIHAIDGALDAGINLFYLSKEGVNVETTPYLKKQRDRIHSVMSYLQSQLDGNYFFEGKQFGISELNLYTTLDWFRFRNVAPVSDFPQFLEFLSEHESKLNLKKTEPPK